MLRRKKELVVHSLLILLAAAWWLWAISLSEYAPNNILIVSIALILSNVILYAIFYFSNIKYYIVLSVIFLIVLIIYSVSIIALAVEQNIDALIISLYIISLLSYSLLLYKFQVKYIEFKATDNLAIETLETECTAMKNQYKAEEIKNISLLKELEKMEEISNIAFTAGLLNDFNELFENIVEATAEILEEKNVLISVYNEKENKFEIKYFKGYNGNNIAGMYTDNVDLWIRDSKLPVLIKDVEKETKIKIRRYSDFFEPKSIIASPIYFNNEVIGVLRIESELPYVYSNEELRILDYITDITSIAYDNLYYFKEVERLAITDGLTGLYVHNYFISKLEDEINRFFIAHSKVSLIMVDVDDFKIYNDKYGHQFGDKVLKLVANIIKNSIRDIDFPARYGGDEFVIILPETDLKGAQLVASRLFDTMVHNETQIFDDELKKNLKNDPLSVSIGVGTFKEKYKNLNRFISEVDKYLYKAKNTGKHKIMVVK